MPDTTGGNQPNPPNPPDPPDPPNPPGPGQNTALPQGDIISIKTQEKAQQALERIDEAIVKKDKVRAHLGAMQNRLEKGIAKGISIGKQEGMTEGIRNVLHDLLQNRFSVLPQDMCASIANMTDTNALRKLTQEVYRVDSLEAFRTLLKQAGVSKK